MSLSVETLAVARKYTDDSLAGAGAVAGVPCKIQSITAITGGNRVTFLWTDNNGDDHTSAMDVMNGVDGEDGKGIQSVSVNAQDHLIITYTDGTTVDAGQIEIHSSVDSVNGQTGAVVLDAEDVGALPDNTPIPSKTSDLTNDSGFATTSDVSTALADYTPTADLTTLLAAKQDTLTFDNAPTENSNNPVKSSGIYSANQNIYEVMGQMGAKNLITYPHSSKTETKAGITFTENADGSVTVNGTATEIVRHLISSQQFEVGKKYILSGCPSGGSHSLNGTYTLYTQTVQNYDDGEGVEFTWDASITGITIAVFAGITVDNLTFKPMLRLASDTDSTYQPYAKTNQQLTAETQALTNQTNDMVNVYGAKNLIPYPYYRPSGYTTNGLTVTYDADGILTVNKVAGEAISFFAFANTKDYFLIPNTAYTLSMELENAVNTSVYIKFSNDSFDTAAIRNKATGKYETTFTTPSTFNGSLQLALYYGAIVVETNAKVKVMLRLASIQDDTYVPYAPTNAKLNEEKMSYADNGVLGAKNLLPTPYYSTKGGTTTSGTLTVTENADGSVTIDGTASEQSYIDLARNDKFLKAGTYILSGGITSKQYVYINCLNNGTYIKTLARAMTSEDKFVLDYNGYDAITVGISIASGESLDNVTFKPMVRLATDSDTTYQPYAKTNRELTEALTVSKGAPTENTDYIASSDLHYEKYGKVVHVFGNFETNTAILGTDALVTLFTNLPNSNGGMNGTSSQYTLCLLHDNTNDGLSYRCFVSNEGKLVSRYKAIPIGTYFADFTYICQ